MKKHSAHFAMISLLSLLLPGCFIPSRYFMRRNLYINLDNQKSNNQSAARIPASPCITIWIHGTRLFSRMLYLQNIPYHEGLSLATTTPLPHKLAAVANTLTKADPDNFNQAHFYIFGWSGKLCFNEREKASALLHKELIALIEHYHQTYNCKPYIRIITHSHGGNVALNLALHTKDTPFVVDELVLLACPVQEKTQHLIRNHMFKKIYVLYSALDIVQLLDPQGIYKQGKRPKSFFSQRNFRHRQELAQMNIKVNKRAITHSEFSQSSFLKLLPKILKGVDEWQTEICYKEDPNKMHKVLCVYTKKSKQNSKETLA